MDKMFMQILNYVKWNITAEIVYNLTDIEFQLITYLI